MTAMFDLRGVLADVGREFRAVRAAAWLPRARVDYNRWAEENVVFGPESPFPGPYNPKHFPWVPGILEALAPHHPAQVVVVLGSAQIGKTVIAQIFAGGSQDMDPGPFLYIHPTTDNALRWVKQKWRTFVRGTRRLSRLFFIDKSRDGGNSLLYQERRDGLGFLQTSGAQSEASLSMMSVPRQVQDDLAKWIVNDAGDPEAQADTRSKAFRRRKILKISTPMVMPGCKITTAYRHSTAAEFQLPCHHCGGYQAIGFTSHLKAAADEWDGTSPIAIACTHCAGKITERDRDRALSQAKWVETQPEKAASLIYGFKIWTAYAATESWESLARKWLRAKGDPAAEQTFLNDDGGEAYEAAGEAPPHEAIRARADAAGLELGVIPVGGLLLVAGVDCQGDRVEVHIKAFGRDLKRYTVEYFVIDGHISEERCRKGLDALLERTWRDAFGNKRKLEMLAIDGAAFKTDVHDWASKHPYSRVIMIRGVHGDHAPMMALVKEEKTADGRTIKFQKRFWNVGAAPIKSSLYKLLQKADPTHRGYCSYPAGLPEEFFRQLCAERRQPVKNKKTGVMEYRWVKIQGQPNEVLDTEIQAEAAAIRLGWRLRTEAQWDALQAQLEKPPADRQMDLEDMLAGASPQTSAPAAEELHTPGAGPDARPRRGDWINGGRRGGWFKR